MPMKSEKTEENEGAKVKEVSPLQERNLTNISLVLRITLQKEFQRFIYLLSIMLIIIYKSSSNVAHLYLN